jgi:hypothetical protein
MVVKLAKEGIASIVHIKNAFAGYPKEELEEQLRGMPGGSHLEMRATVDGISLIAVGSKYNSKKTCFHLAVDGAAPTTDGVPYVTQWPDENRNVLTRNVSRPALVSRYFLKFNKVDISDQLRQHELGLERKWVGKGDKAGKFRIMSTIFGVSAVDTMLAVKCHSHEGNPVRDLTTKEFVELLAEEMVDNELDGRKSRPVSKKRSRSQSGGLELPPEEETWGHKLKPIGRISDTRALKLGEKDAAVQLHCTVCKKKSSTYCARVECNGAVVCNSVKRDCLQKHCSGETPTPDKRRKSV